MLYCISVSYHSRSSRIVFLPRVVFLPPTHPPCFCISSRQGRWQRGLFLLIFPDLYFVSSDVEINFSWPKTNCVVDVLMARTIYILCYVLFIAGSLQKEKPAFRH